MLSGHRNRECGEPNSTSCCISWYCSGVALSGLYHLSARGDPAGRCTSKTYPWPPWPSTDSTRAVPSAPRSTSVPFASTIWSSASVLVWRVLDGPPSGGCFADSRTDLLSGYTGAGTRDRKQT